MGETHGKMLYCGGTDAMHVIDEMHIIGEGGRWDLEKRRHQPKPPLTLNHFQCSVPGQTLIRSESFEVCND